MLCSIHLMFVLVLCPVIQGFGALGQQRQDSLELPSYPDYGDLCATKESVVGLQSSLSSLSTSMETQFNQVNQAVQTRCDIKKVIKTIMSGMHSLMNKNIGELKAVLAEVATKTDIQTLESKQVEMALAQVATDDQLANSTMLLQMELQTVKDQLADKDNLQLIKESMENSASILIQELDLVKKELAELKKTCHGCHTVVDQKVCMHNYESFYEGSFDIGCSEHCECFANSTMVCQNRCNSPYFSVGSFSHDPSCTETPSDSDKCCVTVKCATNRSEIVQTVTNIVAVDNKIPLNESNIYEHGGFRPGGAGPENMLHDNGFWNPNPPPWYVIFDFHARFSVESLELSNFGDVKHDVSQFTLETTDNITDDYKLVTRASNVQKGTNDPQLFTFRPATGRYWRFKVIKTHSIFQPWIEELTFHGHPVKELSCPPQFRQVGSQCLNVVLGPVKDKTWHQAKDVCKHLGGDLAQLQDTTHILHHIITDLGKEDWKFWVGAELKNKSEGFRWNGGSKVSNWEDGQPDNGGFKLFDHSDEHCVELQAWNGKYNDQDCDEERSFICQINPLESIVVEKTINLTQSVIVTTQVPETNNSQQEEQQSQQQHVGQREQENSEQAEQQLTFADVWRNCHDVHKDTDHKIHKIFPFEEDKDKSVMVFCDEEIDGGGWTVIQHRGPRPGDNNAIDKRIDFNKLWHEYKNGFGDPKEDHWLGLDAISALTNQGPTELLIKLGDFEGQQRWAHYDHFIVHNHTTEFTMQVSGYNGDAGDSFSHHSGLKFTTIDADNDRSDRVNCAYEYGGAWWHDSCHESNLNGKYLGGVHSSYADGIEWKAWHGYHYSLNTTTMMVRPRRDEQDDLQQGVIQITPL